ncbi:hypothetical protein ANME2D_01204 [Candidatus Methanoperedens nitroreducens]|uniref:Uncharacterized protein n=1 Tax=Candidatus Methanoperedens nitratireducens TaxID=1392998 RepID=A0A062VBT6_9EURY|nr:hypothetical protein ANME2D_01204 [Candidatus Methanoperedens nitroreducens]
MDISSIALNNLSNKNNISQNLNLGDLLSNNFSSILVITFAVPVTAVSILSAKLKNGASTNNRDVKIIHSSIGCLGIWLMVNVSILIYVGIFNPISLSYNQTVTLYSTSGLLLVLVSFFLSLRESIIEFCRYTCDDLSNLYNKSLRFKCYISTKFESISNKYRNRLKKLKINSLGYLSNQNLRYVRQRIFTKIICILMKTLDRFKYHK